MFQSLHQCTWLKELVNTLDRQLPKMEGLRYLNDSQSKSETYLIGEHQGECIQIVEGIPVLNYVPMMDSYREVVRNTWAWLRVIGDSVFTTQSGTRTVAVSEVLNSILSGLEKIEGVTIHSPLVNSGKFLMLYVKEPIDNTGMNYRHWTITLPVCRIGEFVWH